MIIISDQDFATARRCLRQLAKMPRPSSIAAQNAQRMAKVLVHKWDNKK